MKRFIVLAAAGLSLGACSTIISGTSQEVMVNTNPAGANCALNRKGETIGRINPTPAATTVEKTKDDITIVCNKDGYQQTTYIDKSGIQPATWGNIVAGGLIGWGIDSADGADNHYASPVNITLVPKLAQAPAATAASAAAPRAVPASKKPGAGQPGA